MRQKRQGTAAEGYAAGRRVAPLMVNVKDGIPAYRRWGRLEVTPVQVARMGRQSRYALSVYPPGTTRTERALLHFSSIAGWPGFIVTVLIAVLVSIVFGRAVAVAVFVVLMVAWVLTLYVSRRLRRRVRFVTVIATPHDVSESDGFLRALKSLDDLDSSALDPVSYELHWGRIYDSLAAN